MIASRKTIFIVFASVAILSFAGLVLAVPNGGTISEQGNITAGTSNPDSQAAIAGNISEIDLTGYTTSQTWQGYFGNVTGAIQLADGSSNVLYNWSQTTATGEVYASLNSSIGWSGVGCFNVSTDHTTQLTQLESFFNIDGGDSDGINETFTTPNHASFETGTVAFQANQCNSTKLFGPSGVATFDEVLLIDTSNRTVYASLIDDNTAGFDGNLHDFEMIVPEDGHGVDTSITNYYFYVELG